MFIAALVCAALVLWPVPSHAQTPTAPIVTANQPFQVLLDHDGLHTLGYRLYLDEVQTGPDIPVSSLVNGVLTIPVASVPRGAHSVRVSAFNADHEVSSLPLAFEAKDPAPNAPTNLRIQVTINVTVQVQP